MNTTRRALRAASAPDIWFKTQRALRTIVQALVVLLPIANLAALAVVDYLNGQADIVVPGWIFAGLNAVIVASALIMGLVARLMAVPGVNDLLVKIGLGSVPKSEVVRLEQNNDSTYTAPPITHPGAHNQ